MRPIDRTIDVKVRGAHLTKDNRNAGIQHEANVTFLRIDFDEGWDPYAKTVTFWDALMGNPVKLVLTTDKLEDIHVSHRVYLVPIPGEALGEPGDLTFVIDGWQDGKRKRSLGDTLWVKEAPYEADPAEPTDPTPSQAEQMQVQLDLIISDIQKAEIAASEALGYAEFARTQSDAATSSAQFAQEMADYSYNVKEEAVAAKNEAEAAAETAASDAAAAAEQAIAPKLAEIEAEMDASVAAAVQNAETAAKSASDASASAAAAALSAAEAKQAAGGEWATNADITKHNTSTTAHADIRTELAAVARAKTGGEIDQRLQNRVEKTGDSMTGILTFDTPGLFSAIQKKRTIGSDNYIMKLGVGNYGTGGTISLRLATVDANGTETGAGQFDIDADGLVWITPGGLRKTVAHSGNLGLLTASVE